MIDDGLVRERVSTFAANHPDAAPVDIFARCPDVDPTDPEHRAVVGDVLGQKPPTPAPTSPAARDEHADCPDREDRLTDDEDDGGDDRNESPDSPDTAADSPLDGRSRDANPGCEAGGSPSHERERESEESRKHENPIDIADVSDAERARMLLEYLDAFREEFGTIPRLMPLDAETKAPWITDRASLDDALPSGEELPSEATETAMVDGFEAARRIAQEGAVGFACYAGRQEFGTYHTAFADHDDADAFPAPTGDADPTLEVLSGSGRGTHETFRNDPDDRVRNARLPDEAGEIRAKNWYVVTPGSVHPSGGVYHVVKGREIATLADADLTDDMRSNAKRREGRERRTARDLDGDGDRPDDKTVRDRLEAAFECSPTGAKYRAIYDGRYASAGYSDRSAAEFALANWVDMWVGFGDQAVVASVLDAGNLQKWGERTDAAYRDSILANVGYQDWYAADDGDSDGEEEEEWRHMVALPSGSPKGRVWDWRESGQRLASDDGDADPWLTRREAQQRTQRAIERAYDTRTTPGGTGTIIAALPGLGKSHGAILAAAETGTPISFLTGRGRDEQYQVVKQWCEDAGLDAKVLPAVTEDCPTFAGEHGEEIQATVKGWYENGATGKDVHKYGDRRLDHPLPCQDGGHCPYTAKWDFDPEEYDVLIGHPTHVHVPKVATGRTPVFDEFTDDFEHALVGERLTRAVTRHLKRDPELPFENYTDLIEHRNDDERRSKALARLAETGIDRDHEHAFEDDGHALAPLATTVLLASAIDENQHENGFSTVELPGDGAVGTFYPEWGQQNTPGVRLLLPPDLQYTSGVVGLDGTPTETMWTLALGARFTTDRVLDDEERRTYLADTAGIEFVVTNDHARPVGGNPDELPVASAQALARAVGIKHDAKPDLVTTGTMHGVLAGQRAIDEPTGNSEGANGDGLYKKALYHGNLKGSNRLKHSRVGIVEGSTHYGDEFVQKWAAFAGENAERGEGKGLDLSYSEGGEIGDDVLRHMREHQTLQGALRFGRDGNGATVYVNTNTLPEWVPTKRVGGVLTTKGRGERQAVAAMTDLGGTATGEHGVGMGKREYLLQEHGEAAVEAMRSITYALDPNDTLNPGKMFPETAGGGRVRRPARLD